MTVKLLAAVGAPSTAIFSHCTVLYYATITDMKSHPCSGSQIITYLREDRSFSHCELSVFFRFQVFKEFLGFAAAK